MPKKKEEKKPEIKWWTAAELHKEYKNIERVPTGTLIDELIGGGIEKGEVLEFYGEYESGKTQICYTLICNVKGQVVFIDPEATFRPERPCEIASARGLDPDEILKRIYVAQPRSVLEQMATLEKIPENVKPELLIVDGLTTLFRAEYIGRETLSLKQGKLRNHINDLKNYARNNKCAIIVTNQVYAYPDATSFLPLEYRELAVGGHTLYHSINNRIFLRKASGGTRLAKLVASSMYPPAERPFRITSKGVEALPKKETEKTTEGEES